VRIQVKPVAEVKPSLPRRALSLAIAAEKVVELLADAAIATTPKWYEPE